MKVLSTIAFVILNGASVSGEQDMRPWRVVGIEMPAAWDAAGLSFKSSALTGAEVPMTDTAGAEITFTVAAAKYVGVPDSNGIYRSLSFTKLVSGTNAVPVNQTANRTINLLCLPMDN